MPEDVQFATYARLLRLSPVDESLLSRPEAAAEPEAHAKPRFRVRVSFSFLLLVVLPVCLAAGYFGLFVADRYQSEARFVVRAPSGAMTTTSSASLIQSSAVTRTVDDGYIVQDFLTSRDALKWLEEHADLRAAYAVPKWDYIWRFPSLLSNTDEGLFRHYGRMMSVNYDLLSGITLLKVEAFTPSDAQRMASSLLDAAELLVNRLNRRAQDDAIALAQREVDRMKERALAAQTALTAFRERELMIDPSHSTAAVLETIGRLAYEVAQASVQISQLSQMSANSPQISPLRNKRAILEEQIALERKRLAGDAKAIAPRIIEYERLVMEREFADKALGVAMAALEYTRIEAARRHIYLERVAAPSQPDYPAFPWKMTWCLATLGAGFVAWRMWRFVVVEALRHNEV